MKIFLTILILSLSCLTVNAQQDRFIYLQTENTKPFFVKLNNRTFNSFPEGYLIIPKLDDGIYSLVIRFPESNSEQAFNCSIDQKDVGFIIKNTGAEQWQLLNVQTGSTVNPVEVINKTTGVYETQTDPFSVMLANAVHDSTILRKDVALEVLTDKPAEIKDTTALASSNEIIARPDSAGISKNDSTATDLAKTIPPKDNEVVQKDTTHGAVPVVVLDPDNKVKDSAATDISKAMENKVTLKDSSLTTSGDVTVLNTDSTLNSGIVKTNDTKEQVQERSNQASSSDSSQTNVVKNDVALSRKDKKKNVKKNVKKNDKVEPGPEIAKTDNKNPDEKKTESSDSTRVADPARDVVTARSVIKRRSRRNGKEGMELVYVDDNGDSKDTIRVLMPVEKKEEAKVTDIVVTIPRDDEVKEPVTKNNKRLTKEEKEVIKEANKETSLKSSMINSDCKNFADEDDFLKLRKKMVAEDNEENMIKAAKKIFKTRCFTTEQIKNLSVIFLKEEYRFMFFEVAYPFVSDSEVFSSLEKQLTDENYIGRFRAMIHK